MVFLAILGPFPLSLYQYSGVWVLGFQKCVIFDTQNPLQMTHFCVIFLFQKMIFFYIIAISILIFLAPQFLTGVLVEKCRIEFTYF